MIREKLSRIFSSKIFYIVFSILVSIALWLFVEINENQLHPYTVSGIQIVREHEELLNDRDLLISSITPETLTLTFECPRSVAANLKNTNLSVSIDLAPVMSRGPTTLPYEINFPSETDLSSLTITERSVNRISLYIDRMQSRPVPVVVSYTGGAAEGYIQDSPEYGPQSITVSGPAEAVSSVGTARVNVVRENLSSTYTDDLHFVLYDVSGDELSQAILDQLTISDETIRVTVPIRAMKDVSLNVEFTPGAGATAQNVRVTYEPSVIIVAGDPENVRDFNTINLNTIDLSRFESTISEVFPIIIPNGLTNISGETEARVTVEILGLEIKHMSISNLQVNLPAGYMSEIISPSVDVRIRGRASDLANLTEANIRIVANVTDVSLGTQRLLSTVYVDGYDQDLIGSIGNVYITATILRNE